MSKVKAEYVNVNRTKLRNAIYALAEDRTEEDHVLVAIDDPSGYEFAVIVRIGTTYPIGTIDTIDRVVVIGDPEGGNISEITER